MPAGLRRSSVAILSRTKSGLKVTNAQAEVFQAPSTADFYGPVAKISWSNLVQLPAVFHSRTETKGLSDFCGSHSYRVVSTFTASGHLNPPIVSVQLHIERSVISRTCHGDTANEPPCWLWQFEKIRRRVRSAIIAKNGYGFCAVFLTSRDSASCGFCGAELCPSYSKEP